MSWSDGHPLDEYDPLFECKAKAMNSTKGPTSPTSLPLLASVVWRNDVCGAFFFGEMLGTAFG